MALSTFLREDQAIIHAGVGTVNAAGQVTASAVALPDVYSWSSLQGGDLEAEDTFTRPGGMLPGINLGGPTKRTDVTVMRQYTADLHAFLVDLENACGNTRAWAAFTLLDSDGNKQPHTVTLTGVLKTVQKPNFNSEAAAAIFLGLVIGCDTQAIISPS
jgi:hypothetical protein